ncbi:unnamed protein product [Schistosoma mattheei]|uniref:Uncharacterized protein n=1 Tax=Schistosoma mattheei TaxID=31246 RepID=A0A3P8HG77_9TREM|nr:unnamed protein product [Schistosoma mattheei]
MRALMHPDGFDHVSPSFTVRDVTSELFVLLLTFCMAEMY